VRGKDITEEDLVPMKLSKYIYKYGNMTNQHGILGCFLSHRTLLEHLSNMSCSKNDCHLVLEDDAFVPPDFLTQWNDILEDVPDDWDMIMLGIQFPNLRQLKGRVHTHLANKGNVGTHAYMVRHRALKKITKHLEYMYDAIDLMLRNKWKEWKIYVLWPQICRVNDHGISTIVVQNVSIQ
jgi:GR25 family glycosyltransferase involved in LPS biosynthesis